MCTLKLRNLLGSNSSSLRSSRSACAQVHVPPPLHQAARPRRSPDAAGLPAGDAHHGHRTRRRRPRIRDREGALEDRGGILDFSTPVHERLQGRGSSIRTAIALPARQALLHHVPSHRQHLDAGIATRSPLVVTRLTPDERAYDARCMPGLQRLRNLTLGHQVSTGRSASAGTAHRRASFRAAQVPLMPRWLRASRA